MESHLRFRIDGQCNYHYLQAIKNKENHSDKRSKYQSNSEVEINSLPRSCVGAHGYQQITGIQGPHSKVWEPEKLLNNQF
jgi:hypothetical protein